MNDNFCLLKIPSENDVLIFKNKGNSSNILEFYDFKSKIKYNFNLYSIFEKEDLNIILKEFKGSLNEDIFIKNVKKAINEINDNDFIKVVLSRKIIKKINSINVLQIFYDLICSFTNACVYLLVSKNEIWIGATPELLGNFKDNKFETMALAGTLPNNSKNKWTDKEYNEHQIVIDYISKKLKYFTNDINIFKTKTIELKNIKHLCTKLNCYIDESKLDDLIKELHPTPAVCGIEKQKSFEFINENENHDRELYTGYIKIKLPNEIFYYVNLRCLKIYKNMVEIFVGAGITKDSVPENEYKETELKSNFILSIIE